MRKTRTPPRCLHPLLGCLRLGVLSAWVAIVAVAAHLAMLGHMVLVSHVRCEHGLLAHRVAETTSDADDGVRPDRSSSAVSATSLPHAGEAHDHCRVTAVNARVASAVHGIDGARWLPAIVHEPIGSSSGICSVPILLLAPKTSPTA